MVSDYPPYDDILALRTYIWEALHDLGHVETPEPGEMDRYAMDSLAADILRGAWRRDDIAEKTTLWNQLLAILESGEITICGRTGNPDPTMAVMLTRQPGFRYPGIVVYAPTLGEAMERFQEALDE